MIARPNDAETFAFMCNLRAEARGETAPYVGRAKPCAKCDGRCVATESEGRRCGRCRGSGEERCDLGHLHECEECDGDGSVLVDHATPCSTCAGFGYVVPRADGGIGWIEPPPKAAA